MATQFAVFFLFNSTNLHMHNVIYLISMMFIILQDLEKLQKLLIMNNEASNSTHLTHIVLSAACLQCE